MNERCLEVLSLYNIKVEKTARGRGAYLVWTDKGLFRLSEYTGTEGRLSYEAEILKYLKEVGFERVDYIMPTVEDKLWVEDAMGVKYILKQWYDGHECDVKKISDIIAAVQTLACLHISTERIKNEAIRAIAPKGESMLEEYRRHNKELKRVRNFMRGRNRKTQFEYDVLAHFDEYYSYAEEAYNSLKSSGLEFMELEAWERCSICHGTYNYHNIIMNGSSIAVVNFNHSVKGMQLQDLYFFLRKVMEKHDWNVQLGSRLLEQYQMIKALDADQLSVLRIMLSYPEKFWKVLNRYNNSNKSWIPDKNVEKLEIVYKQQELKKEFARKVCI